MGGEPGREWIHANVWLSPFAVHLKISQRCCLAILQYETKSLKDKMYSCSFHSVGSKGCLVSPCWLFHLPWMFQIILKKTLQIIQLFDFLCLLGSTFSNHYFLCIISFNPPAAYWSKHDYTHVLVGFTCLWLESQCGLDLLDLKFSVLSATLQSLSTNEIITSLSAGKYVDQGNWILTRHFPPYLFYLRACLIELNWNNYPGFSHFCYFFFYLIDGQL